LTKPIILSIESSGNFGSVSLARGEEILYSSTSFIEQSHSAMLAPLIEKSLQATNLLPVDLQAIAVGSGPGSYTGLRIGVSLAKGLCFALKIPLISVGTMQNLAFQAIKKSDKKKILCLLDARRNEVYAQAFDLELQSILPLNASVLETLQPEDFFLNQEMVLVGDGAKKTMAFFQFPTNWSVLEDIFPYARTVSALAFQKFETGEFESLADFEPEYLKPVYLTQAVK
jgi:tRNA threonylcarbamoyladenosine biosynthesis protein TsaB